MPHITVLLFGLLASPCSAKWKCRDIRQAPGRCAAMKEEGRCDEWGCDWTCGRCHLPNYQPQTGSDMAKITKFAFDDYDTVRKGDWWLSYAYATGGFTTVVVPTLCKRLDRLRLLANELSTMSCVREVLVTSSGPCVGRVKATLQQPTEKAANMTTIVDMGEWDGIYGPASRFLAARRASGTVLVHLDDDEFPCEKQLCTLAARALKEPIGIYGQHKRTCNEEGYRTRGDMRRPYVWARAKFNVLLTLFASTSRAFNDAFVRHYDHYARALASTRGNGEDIAYSHFLLRFYNRTPVFVQKQPCGHWEVNGTDVFTPYFGGFSKLDDGDGMSDGSKHYATRRRMCRMLWNKTSWTMAIGHRAPQLVPTTRLVVELDV